MGLLRGLGQRLGEGRIRKKISEWGPCRAAGRREGSGRGLLRCCEAGRCRACGQVAAVRVLDSHRVSCVLSDFGRGYVPWRTQLSTGRMEP